MYYLIGQSFDSQQIVATFSTKEKAERYVEACIAHAYPYLYRGLLTEYRCYEIREVPSDPELP